MRVLITGATGFVGRHFVEHLRAVGGYELHGVARRSVADLQLESLNTLDLNDTAAVAALLRHIQPDAIVHLAGYASAAKSFTEPTATWSGNLGATLSLFCAVAEWGAKPRILFVGSGAVYGNSLATANPCTEETPLLPDHPYAASKAAADLAAYQAFCFPGLPVIRVRPFNQIGPGQGSGYAISGFAERIARMEAELMPPVLGTANLDMERDMTDVRDMVRAYRLLLERGQPGEAYNAGTGKPVHMREATNALLAKAKRPIELKEDKSRRRPADVQVMRIDIAKLRAATGWSTTIPFEQSLDNILNDWRQRVAQSA
jgi:GDP-4-dehydro-6-deoxy-D-mannose reductase